MIRNKTEQNAWFAALVKSCSLFKHLESLIPYNFYVTNGMMVYNKSHDKKKKKEKRKRKIYIRWHVVFGV